MDRENPHLSGHDKAVLNKIFNPNLPFSDVVEEDLRIEEDDIESVKESEDVKEAKRLEIEGVKAAERGAIAESISLFSQAIELSPGRGSCYNNRAQSWQLNNNVEDALEDLNVAIELSRGKGKVACQAYTQRGVIYRFQKQDEEAMEDFKKAAALGGEFAKQQVVAMNPYAAMCNQMLTEVMGKIKVGEM